MVDVLSMTNSDEKAIKLASHQTRSDLREPIALDGQTSATVLDVSISTREGWNVFLLDCSIQWKIGVVVGEETSCCCFRVGAF